MRQKEINHIKNTFRDKKEEIEKCLNHYRNIGDFENEKYFKAQLDLLNELKNEYFQNLL